MSWRWIYARESGTPVRRRCYGSGTVLAISGGNANRVFKRLWSTHRSAELAFSTSRKGPIFESKEWDSQWDALADALADWITDLITLIGAVLHDTIEDTQTTAAELDEQFGKTVRKLVEELTDDKTLDKPTRKQLQIEHASGLSARAKVVKLADKIANLRDVLDNPRSEWTVARRIEYLEWTEQVVAGCRGANPPLERLYDQVVEKGRVSLQSAG